MLDLIQVAILYVMLLWAEFWLLARIVGNRLEGAPAIVRAALLIVLFSVPAFVAIAIMNAPHGDLPESY